MSDVPQKPTNQSSASPATDESASKSPKTKRPRRWRRKFLITFSALLILGVIFRIALTFLLPTVLNRVAGIYGLNCTYERLEMSLLGGDVGLWHLQFTPQAGGEPLLTTGYVRGNISTLALLTGRLDVWRAEVDGVDLSVDREADGSIPILRQFLAQPSSAPVAKPAAPGAPTPLTLKPPLTLDALRVQRVRARFRDKTMSPPLVSELLADVRVSDVGSSLRPTQFQIVASFDPIFDTIRIDGEGRTDGKELNASVQVWARGVRPREAAPYLAAFGIKPVANEISAKMSGKLKASLVSTPQSGAQQPTDALAVNLAMSNVALAVDGKEAAAVDQVTIDADRLTLDEVSVARIDVEGVRAGAQRAANGRLVVAGAEIVPVSAPAPTTAPITQPIVPGSGGPIQFRASLGELVIKNVHADWRDLAVGPEANVSLAVNTFSLKHVLFDAKQPDSTSNFEASLALPGVARAVNVKGAMQPFAGTKTVSFAATIEGIRPDALKPYLDLLHLESQFENGSLTADMKASVSLDGSVVKADAAVGKIVLKDKGELLAFDGAAVAGARVDLLQNLIHVDSIELTGPSVRARRNEDGGLSAVGLRKKMPGAQPLVAVRSTEPGPAKVAVVTPTAQPVKLPTVEIGKFTWKGIKANLEDAMNSPPTAVSLADAGVEVTDLRLSLDSSDAKPSSGTIHAWLSAPGAAEKLSADGSISSSGGGATIELAVTGDGLKADLLRPYLAPLGVEPTLKNGSVAAKTKLSIAQTSDSLNTSMSISSVKFTDGAQELLGVESLSVDDVSLKSGEVSVGRVQIDRPRASVSREADGSFLAVGMRLRPGKQPSVKVEEPLQTRNATPTPEVTPATTKTTSPFAGVLKRFHLSDGRINWTDGAVQPNVSTTASANVDLDGFVFGRPSAPANLKISARVADSVDRFSLAGTVSAAPDAPFAKLAIEGAGIRAGQLAAYLPPGINVTLKDGRFSSNLEAAMGRHPKGGQSAKLIIDHLSYSEGMQPLFELDVMKLVASQIDLPDKALAIEEISASGIETDAKKSADGSIEALGVSIKVPPAQPSAAGAESPSAQLASDTVPPAQPVAAPVSASDAAAAMIASKKKPLPLITLEKLDIGVKRATFTDLSRPKASPLALADVSVKNLSRVELLGNDASSRPPVKLQLAGKVDPLMGSFRVDVQTSPFAQQPNVMVDVSVAGIRGDGLTALVPELKEQIDGSNMSDGTFGAHIEATTKFDRRTPLDFDLSRGFGLSFLAKDIAFRALPDGPILAGLESVESEGIQVRPSVGGVHVKSLDVVKPIALVVREKDGIHALGWVIKLPAGQSTTQPTTTVAIEREAPKVPTVHSPGPVVTGEKPKGEIRIDRLTISGLDLRIEDRSVDPHAVLPLTDLDVEVKGLSNWAMYEEMPIRFSAVVNAGKVQLPRPPKGGFLPGALGDAAALFGGKKIEPTTRELEQRDLWSQVLASGQISLYPKPKGWMKTSVSGFELTSVEGIAKQSGVNIASGVFDSSIDVRLPGDGSAETRSKLVLTDLTMTEPPNGPFFRYLHLPAPLDAVIGALQDASGSISIPLSVPVKQGTVSVGDVAGSAVGALAQVFATAIASAPIKVVSGVGDLLGGGGDKKPVEEKPIVLGFEAGSTLAPDMPPEWRVLLERMNKDKSLTVTMRGELGSGDVLIAGQRANPSPADCLSLQSQLRGRKAHLIAVRAEVLGQSRGQLGSGYGSEAAASIVRLKQIDRELAEIEDTLDKLYEILRPGADRQAGKRTRVACLEIARARLGSMQKLLLSSKLPDIANRLTIINATFNPAEDTTGGRVTLLPVKKK